MNTIGKKQLFNGIQRQMRPLETYKLYICRLVTLNQRPYLGRMVILNSGTIF